MFRHIEQISASKKSMHIRKCCSYISSSVQSKFKVKKGCRKIFSFSFLLRLNLITIQYFPNTITHCKVLLVFVPAGNICADSAAFFFFFSVLSCIFTDLYFRDRKPHFCKTYFSIWKKKKLLWMF